MSFYVGQKVLYIDKEKGLKARGIIVKKWHHGYYFIDFANRGMPWPCFCSHLKPIVEPLEILKGIL